MAYVPGFANDLFISYAHGDNEGRWVSGFHERLRIRLRELLPFSPVIWRDERLGSETNFPLEIRRQIGSTAVVLVVVSPAYLASSYCRLERRAFNQAAATQGSLNVGTSLRIVKVVKTPKENNEHHLFLKETLGFEFFRTVGERDFEEFIPGQREFDSEVDRLARRIRDLLRAMRNQRQAIFVAEAPNELEPVWESVRNELSANGYRVAPTDRLDPDFFDEKVLRAELEPAILSVHLFSGEFDEFSARQARQARALDKPAVIWVAPDSSLDARQRDFLNTHAGYSDGGIRYAFLTKCREWQLPRTILEELKPKRELASTEPGAGVASIYLICDRTDPAETEFAMRLRDSIIESEKMQVLLPSMDKDPALLDEEHWNSLSVCDGVLLYWGSAGNERFQENAGDIRRASRRLRLSRPYRSEAILLGEPDSPEKGEVEGRVVIRGLSERRLDRLEPFLAPLRNGDAGQ
jgi:hypothetical protein